GADSLPLRRRLCAMLEPARRRLLVAQVLGRDHLVILAGIALVAGLAVAVGLLARPPGLVALARLVGVAVGRHVLRLDLDGLFLAFLALALGHLDLVGGSAFGLFGLAGLALLGGLIGVAFLLLALVRGIVLRLAKLIAH